jgi:hypothetical protein
MTAIRNRWTIATATVALLAAGTGATLAHSSASAPQITPAQVKRIADAEIRRLAPTLAVRSARSIGVYAQVSASGSVGGNTQGISTANISHPSRGFYCFSGLSPAPKGGIAILDALPSEGFSGPNQAQVGIGSPNRCPAGTQALVATFSPNEGFTDDPFMVVFWS